MEPDSVPSSNKGIQSVDDLLSSTLHAAPQDDYDAGISAAAGVSKVDYNKLYSFQNVISHSMEEVLNSCPRKFQIAKLAAGSAEGRPRYNNVTFAFGHAVGAGVAVYDKTQSLRSSIWAAFLAWDIDLFAHEEHRPPRPDPKKSFAFVVYALEKYATWHAENMMDQYEVVELEATVCVDLETGDQGGEYLSDGKYGDEITPFIPTQYHTGHIDELLRHKVSGNLRVKENKTTSLTVVDPAMYANSNQTLGYSVVVAQFGAAEYDVLYTVYSSTEMRWISFDFPKTRLSRAQWLKTETQQAEVIRIYADDDFFPMRGSSCYAYNRQCEHFGSCNMDLKRQFGVKFSELPVASLDALQQVEHFKYVTTRTEIVKQLRADLNKGGDNDSQDF